VTATEREPIVARAERATTAFYDDHTEAVRSFCASLCPAERVEDAMEATFLDFVARVAAAPSDADREGLLRRAVREVAASRMDPAVGADRASILPVCRAMPELLAASANGELPAEYEPLTEHLQSCEICQGNHRRMESAEAAFGALAQRESADRARSTAANPPARRPASNAAPAPIRVRARRGGLVGVVRRLTDR
jgi:hypothetical protein